VRRPLDDVISDVTHEVHRVGLIQACQGGFRGFCIAINGPSFET
jgi:hypothetical protein